MCGGEVVFVIQYVFVCYNIRQLQLVFQWFSNKISVHHSFTNIKKRSNYMTTTNQTQENLYVISNHRFPSDNYGNDDFLNNWPML